MRRPLVTIDAAATVVDAARHMEAHRVGCLVIMRGGAPVGIVTERDIVWRVLGAGRAPTTPVTEVMSRPLATVARSDSVETAAEKMKLLRVKRLVVVDGGAAMGVISVTDIAYAEPAATRAMMDAWVKPHWND